MFAFQSTLFQGDPLLQAIADDAPAPGGGLTRISVTQNRRDPAVRKVQLALLDWHDDVLPLHGADGDYGGETAGAVHRFKAEELGVPEEQIIDDVGPLTVQRLDAIRAAAEAPTPADATVTIVNQYGEPLAGVLVTADDGTSAVSDEQGVAALAIGDSMGVTLDEASVLTALGDLLDRPAQDFDPGAATVITPNAAVPLAVGPGEQLDLVVIGRIDLEVPLLVPLEGTPRVEGSGAQVSVAGGVARVALQATGGETATIVLDPPPAGVTSVELPQLTTWQPPDGYVVQPGDTEADLAARFLDDPDAFSQLSDHPPVPGETLTLPPEAVPGWVASAAAPLPDPPAPQTWVAVAPDAVLAAHYEDGDPAPLHELVAALQAPPAAGEDPADVLESRAEVLVAFASLGPDAGVVDPPPVSEEPEA